jgi:hypothetical protein
VSGFSERVAAQARAGSAQFSQWDAPRYTALADRVGAALAERLSGQPLADRVVDGYLKLLAEAVGLGLLDQSQPTLLGTLLSRVWPDGLPALAPEARLAALVHGWTVGEALAAEPRWLQACVLLQASALTDPSALDRFLLQALTPALAAARPSTFLGPYAQTSLSLELSDDLFLPGAVHRAAPSVLCVHDRKRPAQVAVLLAPQGGSRALGACDCLCPEVALGGDGPPVAVKEAAVAVGQVEVKLPLARRIQRADAFGGGYVVVSAVDSQRLWVLDSP